MANSRFECPNCGGQPTLYSLGSVVPKGNPLRIVKLKKTCYACPSQWEGETDDGRKVYIRYRWGGLSVGVGPTIDDAIRDDYFYDDAAGHCMDGFMELSQLRSLTEGILELPESDGAPKTCNFGGWPE